ncbi:hypothetical protein CMI37_06250 [Candidatus Pacearchaeota archaeon]|nr:hypothetical protein [Candidatus Pacearchaeota archaeon]
MAKQKKTTPDSAATWEDASVLMPWADNPRDNDDAVEGVANSIKRFGFAAPIVARKADGMVIAGHTRLKAAQRLGLTKVPVRYMDLDPADSALLALADNKLSEAASWDDDALASIISKLDEDDALLAGFDAEEVRSLLGEDLPVEAEPGQPRPFADSDIVDAAFDYFRATGFPYRQLALHVSMQEINKLSALEEGDGWRTSNLGYHVADTYHPHRFHATVKDKRAPAEAFEEDAWLRQSLELALEYGGAIPAGAYGYLSLTRGAQACSNFRPAVAMMMYRRHCPEGGTALDTSTGYGGRLVGFFAANNVKRYIGIDPSVETHAANVQMTSELGFDESVELINLPAEDVPVDELRDSCDFAFTSPPYFSKEHYCDEPTQSWVRYKTPESWRDGFLAPVLALQFAALRSGALSIVNIADVKVSGKLVQLEEFVVEAALAAGFEHVGTERFTLTTRFGANQAEGVPTEPMFHFLKP